MVLLIKLQERVTTSNEIMTEYLLSQDDDNDIIVDNRLSLGHLSIDDIEGVYFIKF